MKLKKILIQKFFFNEVFILIIALFFFNFFSFLKLYFICILIFIDDYIFLIRLKKAHIIFFLFLFFQAKTSLIVLYFWNLTRTFIISNLLNFLLVTATIILFIKKFFFARACVWLINFMNSLFTFMKFHFYYFWLQWWV